MKKGVLIGVIAVVVVAGIAVAAVAMRGNRDNATNSTNTTATNSDSSTSDTNMDNGSGNTGDTPVATDSVSIKDMSFSPAEITVKKGTTVTWTNNDGIAHTVTGDDGGPDSGTLDGGKTYKFTFNEVGTFSYHCNFHSNMTGKVTVTE